MWQVAQNNWQGIREAFHCFDPSWVASMTPAELSAIENNPRVIRNKAKIQATVDHAREVLTYSTATAAFALISPRSRTHAQPPLICGVALNSLATQDCGGS